MLTEPMEAIQWVIFLALVVIFTITLLAAIKYYLEYRSIGRLKALTTRRMWYYQVQATKFEKLLDPYKARVAEQSKQLNLLQRKLDAATSLLESKDDELTLQIHHIMSIMWDYMSHEITLLEMERDFTPIKRELDEVKLKWWAAEQSVRQLTAKLEEQTTQPDIHNKE